MADARTYWTEVILILAYVNVTRKSISEILYCIILYYSKVWNVNMALVQLMFFSLLFGGI